MLKNLDLDKPADISVSVVLSKEDLELLHQIAKSKQISRSKFIREAVRKSLLSEVAA